MIPCNSRLWNVRLAIQRGFEALFAVHELDQLQSATNPHSPAYAEVSAELHRAARLLAMSLGIKTPDVVLPDMSGEHAVQTDVGLVIAILQMLKGKKLMYRCFPLLNPEHRLVRSRHHHRGHRYRHRHAHHDQRHCRLRRHTHAHRDG